MPQDTTASHDRHDLMLVAALAAGDLAGADRDRARDQVATCTECRILHDDLVAIAKATATVPAPIVSVGRDFRLTPEQAARLRPSGWRRLLPAASGDGSLTRPLGVALATFGLAGLLIGALPLGALGGASSSAAQAPVAAPGVGANDASGPEVVSGGGPVRGAASVAPAASAGGEPAPVPAASAAAASAGPPAADLGSQGSGAGTPQGAAPSGLAAFGPGSSLAIPRPASSGQQFEAGGGAASGGTTSGGGVTTAGAGKNGQTAVPAGEGSVATSDQAAQAGPSPLVIGSLVALVLGVVLVAASLRRRPTSA